MIYPLLLKWRRFIQRRSPSNWPTYRPPFLNSKECCLVPPFFRSPWRRKRVWVTRSGGRSRRSRIQADQFLDPLFLGMLYRNVHFVFETARLFLHTWWCCMFLLVVPPRFCAVTPQHQAFFWHPHLLSFSDFSGTGIKWQRLRLLRKCGANCPQKETLRIRNDTPHKPTSLFSTVRGHPYAGA